MYFDFYSMILNRSYFFFCHDDKVRKNKNKILPDESYVLLKEAVMDVS